MTRNEWREKLMPILSPELSTDEKEAIIEKYYQEYKHTKHGTNVIHLSFDGPLLTEEEIEAIDNLLKAASFEFSYRDESKVEKAGDVNQELVSWIHTHIDFVEVIKNSIMYPAAWEAFKFIVTKAFNGIKNINSKGKDKSAKESLKTITIHIQNENNWLSFQIKGDIKEKTLLKAIDKIENVIKSTGNNSTTNDQFSHDEQGNWSRIDQTIKTVKKSKKKKRKEK